MHSAALLAIRRIQESSLFGIEYPGTRFAPHDFALQGITRCLLLQGVFPVP